MKTNNRQYIPPVEMQGFPNDCQANGFAGMYQTIFTRATKQPCPQPSRTWLYGQAFRRDGLTPDLGSAPSMAAVQWVAENQGVMLEADWPYDPAYVSMLPTPEQAAVAALRKSSHSYTIPIDPYNGTATGQLVRKALADGYIVGMSFKLRRWFQQLNGPDITHIEQSQGDQTHLFGHFIYIIDFDDSYAGLGLVFRFVNCAGPQFGCPEDSTGIFNSNTLRDAITLTAVRGYMGHTDRWTYDADGVPGEVYRLYQAAFNRTPDKGGLGYQIDAVRAGLPMWQLAMNFMASPEGQQKLPPTLTNAQYVDRLYDNVLHRPGDAQGLAHHLANLNAGIARHDVLMQFSESPENKTACAPAFDRGVAYT